MFLANLWDILGVLIAREGVPEKPFLRPPTHNCGIKNHFLPVVAVPAESDLEIEAIGVLSSASYFAILTTGGFQVPSRMAWSGQ